MDRGRLSEAERDQIWVLASEGRTMAGISREVARPTGTVRDVLRANGGIRPRRRSRAPDRLGVDEREEISRGLASGESCRAIARRLGRSCSTVSREVARNGGRRRYRAADADRAAWDRARRPKAAKLAMDPTLRAIVEAQLELRWSPQQIAGWLARVSPDDPELRVSHETIYQSLFVQTRGALRRELTADLRTGRVMRRGRGHTVRGSGKGQLTNVINIRERPAEVEDRAVPGHWEGDLLYGAGNTAVATLVERRSRYVMLIGLHGGKTSDKVIAALADKIGELPEQLRRSITWDNGKEMALHADFTIATGVQIYICDPKSPWQRGSNENTNGLLRQYLPKRTSFAGHSQADLDAIAHQLNGRPRQTLGFMSPSEVLAAAMH
jgi:IS30 family transposase